MAKISVKKSNLKTIANKIIVSPSTAAVSDLKFKRKKDFSTFLKWIESSNKALARIKLPSKKEIEKLGGGGGGFPWLLALLGVGGLGAAAASKWGDGGIDGIQKFLLQDEIRTATDFSGELPKKFKVPKKKSFKIKKTKIGGPKKTKIKSSTLKKFNKGTTPTVTNTGKGVKVIRPGGGPPIGFETGKGKFSSTPGKAPEIPKKIEVKTEKIIKKNPLKKVKLTKGFKGFLRGTASKVGGALAAFDVAHTTVDRLQEGQTVKQATIGAVAEGVGSWYGFGAGFKLGSAVTGKISLPLLAIPKVGWVAYPLVTLAGGIAGGYAGSKIGRSMAGGLADRFTGVLEKAKAVNEKKSVTEEKKDKNNIASGETIVPIPFVLDKGSDNGMSFGDAMNFDTSSSSFSMPPIDDGLNSSLTDLFLGSLK